MHLMMVSGMTFSGSSFQNVLAVSRKSQYLCGQPANIGDLSLSWSKFPGKEGSGNTGDLMKEQPVVGKPMKEQPRVGEPMKEQPVVGEPMKEQPVVRELSLHLEADG